MKRSYVQRARAEATQRTRERVLKATRDVLLSADDYSIATAEVARRAGVARSTVYAVFGSRAGLLSALADDTLYRAGFAEVVAAYRNPNAITAVRDSIAASCRMYAADQEVFRRLLMLASVDADAAVPIARSQSGRAAGMADLARRLWEQHALRDGVGVDRAAHVLSVVTSFWAFEELSARGLGINDCSELLIAITGTVTVED